mgnify:CR=1 FL=1
MLKAAKSKNGESIRLSDARWTHIVEHHDDLPGYRDQVLSVIEEPDVIVRGKSGELLALKARGDLTLVAVYREISRTDGFIITAFLTSQPERIRKRGVAWQKR